MCDLPVWRYFIPLAMRFSAATRSSMSGVMAAAAMVVAHTAGVAVEAATADGGSVYATLNSEGHYHWGGTDGSGADLGGEVGFASLQEAQQAAEAAVSDAAPQQATARRRTAAWRGSDMLRALSGQPPRVEARRRR